MSKSHKSECENFALKPKKKTSTEMFQEMVQLLVVGFFVFLGVLQVPWFLGLLIPCCSEKDASLTIQAVQMTVPITALGVIFLMAVYTYVAQCEIMQVVARERSCKLSPWQETWVYLPIIRHVFINFFYPLRRERGFRFTAGIFSVSVFAALGVSLYAGVMNPVFLLLMVVCFLVGIRAMRLLTGASFSRTQRINGFVLAGGTAAYLIAGYSFNCNLNQRLEEERRHWQKEGIPYTRAKAEKLYYAGTAPNAEFTRLCKRDKHKEANSLYAIPKAYYSAPLSERKQLRAYLDSEEARQDFGGMAKLIKEYPFLKCRIEFTTPLSDTLLPQLNYAREVSRYFGSRIVCAAENGYREEAMHQFRLLDRFLETALQNNFVIGTLVTTTCEMIRSDAIAVLIGSGIMTDDDLVEVEKLNSRHPEKFRQAIRRGERNDAAIGYEFIAYNNVPLESPHAYKADYLTCSCLAYSYWKIFKDDYISVNPLFLWTNVSANLNMLHWMRHKRRIIEYYDKSEDYYLREDQRIALMNAYKKRPLFSEGLLDSAHFQVDRKYARLFTVFRMTDLGLKIERFRRANGHLPGTLDELGVELPVDAQSGEPIRYTAESVRVWEWERCSSKMIPRELPGWQLYAPGRNLDYPGEEAKEYKRDCFTVITQWPVPAPPEPPEAEENPFSPFCFPLKKEESKP